MKAIYFDMDGTLADLYNVSGWLDSLHASDPSPYMIARPMLHFSTLARLLNILQHKGYVLGVISWLAKNADENYNTAVTIAKTAWLKRHLPSVHWNEITIVPYGTPKEEVASFPNGILFDDNESIRKAWSGTAYDVDNIIEILKGLK